jgi:hypothetical protein
MDRNRLAEVAVPMFVVGAFALLARLVQQPDGTAAPYLIPLALAIALGFLRPSPYGGIGVWLGWSLGVAFGWMIETGEFWFTGPAAYGAMVALLPFGIGSAIRLVLGRRAT